MRRLISTLLLLIATASIAQISKDNLKISIGKYSFNPYYIFSNKPSGTFLAGDERVIISFPERVDTIEVFNSNGESHLETEVSSFFSIDRIIDTLCFDDLDSLIKSTITIYEGETFLRIDRISLKILFPDGKFYNTNFKSNIISPDSIIGNYLDKHIENSYIVLGPIWFYDKESKRQKICDEVGWKLRNCKP